ncbi:MAG: Serine/threonine protein kinase [Armatimonadetes bacterium]|nr:Serine/threonine protein kinase [Armatimonadota bacterium]
MLRWVFKQKAKAAEEREHAAAQSELEFLRSHEDFDAEEMASVRSAPLSAGEPKAEDAAGSFGAFGDPGVTQPAIKFQESLFRSERQPVRPVDDEDEDAGAPGELTLAVTAESRTSTITISESALIGREDPELQQVPEIDLSDDDAVSRRHARIFRGGGRFWLRDLDSTNGTSLNGNWLEPGANAALQVGDLIELGEISRLRVVEVTFDVEMTDEDQMLSGLLDEAMGVSPATESWASAPAFRGSGAPAAVDLLDLALACSVEAGLMDEAPTELPAEMPAKLSADTPGAQWRIREFDGADLSSLVEPAR